MQKPRPKVQIVKFAPLGLRKDYEDNDHGKLMWSVRNGYPRITVYTSNKSVAGAEFDYNTMITAPFDYVNIEVFIDMMDEILKGANGETRSIKCFNTKWVNNEPTKELILKATATVGKDKDGIIWLAILEEGKRKVKFDLTIATKWHVPMKNGEEIADKASLSSAYAKSYIATARRLLGISVVKDTLEKQAPSNTEGTKQVANTASVTEDDLF